LVQPLNEDRPHGPLLGRFGTGAARPLRDLLEGCECEFRWTGAPSSAT
jgi:hypothetical protein